MRTFIAATLVIGLLAVLPASSQQPQTNPAAQAPTDVAKPSPNSAQSDADKGKDSTIVFFREHHFTGSALKPSIYLDGKETDASLMVTGFQSTPSLVNTNFSPAPRTNRRR